MKNSMPLLDALDRRIVDLLTVDARVSNRQIAAQLGVTEGTIRGRINRLEQGGAIRLTAVTNVAFAGSPKVVLIGIQAQHGELRAVESEDSGHAGNRLRHHHARPLRHPRHRAVYRS